MYPQGLHCFFVFAELQRLPTLIHIDSNYRAGENYGHDGGDDDSCLYDNHPANKFRVTGRNQPQNG